MTKYVSFKSNGDLYQYGNIKKNLGEIKTIKEKNGVTVFSITSNQYDLLQAKQTASETGGVVTVTEPSGWLNDYKKKHKGEQKQIGIELFKDYRNDIGNSDANVSTYKTSLKDYFISDIQTPINTASDKVGVDTAIAAVDWSSVVVP
tara:strand:+ start:315 stop:755 length:441 start_codon:yes stop_codon:yes gene_type:complete